MKTNKMTLPSVRTTLIILGTVAIIGFFNITNFDGYRHDGGLIYYVFNGEIDLWTVSLPYRWIISFCVIFGAVRLSIRRPKVAPSELEP